MREPKASAWTYDHLSTSANHAADPELRSSTYLRGGPVNVFTRLKALQTMLDVALQTRMNSLELFAQLPVEHQ